MASTVKPSGITISKTGNRLNASWKTGQVYTKQQYRYTFTGTYPSKAGVNTRSGYININEGTTHTASVDIPLASLFPSIAANKCTEFKLSVRGYGQTTNKWSDWSAATYKFLVPNDPTIARQDVRLTPNVNTDYVTGKGDPQCVDLIYEWVQSTVSKQANVKWSANGKGNKAGSYHSGTSAPKTTITTAYEQGYVTWFRCRARGVAGNSKNYTYINKMYADPLAPTGVSASAKGLNITVNWEPHNTAANPTDYFRVSYCIGSPGANLAPPASPSWVVGATMIAKTAKTVTFTVPQRPGTDKCLWVKVTSVYDAYETDSDIVFAQDGAMAAPTIISVNVDQHEKSAVLTWRDNSTVPDSKIAVVFSDGSILGSFAHGVTTGTVTYKNTSDIQFGIFAFQGSTPSKYNMRSEIVFPTGVDVPLAPTGLVCIPTAKDGTVALSWNNAWTGADGAEISYADHEDAWYSTDEPKRYEITERKTKWNVAGLATGKKWIFAVRSIGKDSTGAKAYSPYSNTVSIDLASAPEAPSLAASDSVIDVNETLTLNWAYTSTDKTDQALAIVYDRPSGNTEVFTGDGSTTTFTLSITPSSIVSVTVDGEAAAYTQSGKEIIFASAPERRVPVVIQYAYSGEKVEIGRVENNSLTLTLVPGWDYGSTHNLTVTCTSESGYVSVESNSVQVLVAPEPTVNSISGAISAGITNGVLEALPLTLNVTGAGTGGTTAIEIRRLGEHHIVRPDDSEGDGFDGETIFATSYKGERSVSIYQEDLLGRFDDGAHYRLKATVTDEVGQSAYTIYDFKVEWTHQAEIPEATVTIDDDMYAVIRVEAPEHYAEGDVVDIYRLSADKPELIIEGGSYGTDYVDPFPAYNGGYRCVNRTINGDYITADDRPAWVDIFFEMTFTGVIIDFDGQRVELPYNMELSNSWTKDFEATKYLNGHVAGDWNAGIIRAASISSISVKSDSDTAEAMRSLAVYEGQCHVRTSDGSSFSADVQVDEYRRYNEKYLTFNLTITRVEPDGLDGVERIEY